MKRAVVIVGLVMVAGAAPGVAQTRHNDWSALAQRDGSTDRLCYAFTRPARADMNPQSFDHGDVSAIVSSWRSGKAKEQPSFQFGYALKPEGPIRARVGNKRWSLYAVGNSAYIEDNDDEADLVDAMRAGARLRVEAVSQDGVETSYEFSLRGVTKALDDVRDSCR